jgi:hypothetical protein
MNLAARLNRQVYAIEIEFAQTRRRPVADMLSLKLSA